LYSVGNHRLTPYSAAFFSSLIKDIRAERSKVTEKDNLRLLFVSKFFIQFFLAMRERDISQASTSPTETSERDGQNGEQKKSDEEKMTLGYSLVLEVVQRGWAGWILKRMREAADMKPKQWTELHAGLECLTQLVSAPRLSTRHV
jgi:replication fork protection complex subunit Tof1/Swi1